MYIMINARINIFEENQVKIIKNTSRFNIYFVCLSVTWYPTQEYFAHIWRRQCRPMPSIKIQFSTSISKYPFFIY